MNPNNERGDTSPNAHLQRGAAGRFRAIVSYPSGEPFLLDPRFPFILLEERTGTKTTIDGRSPNPRTIALPWQRTQGLQGPVIQFPAGPESVLLLEIAYGSDGFRTGLTVNFPTIKSPPRQLILYCLHDALLYLAGCSGIQRSGVHH